MIDLMRLDFTVFIHILHFASLFMRNKGVDHYKNKYQNEIEHQFETKEPG